MFISFEKKTYGACLASLLALSFSQPSYANDVAEPSAKYALDQQVITGVKAQTHDVLGSELAAQPELELVTPLALGPQRGNDRQGDLVIDRRMFKHLRVEKNANVLLGEKELQESEALRSKLAKSAFAEALEKAKLEGDARADRAARKRESDWQQRQLYECVPVLREFDKEVHARSKHNQLFNNHCAPQVSGVPLPQHGVFPQ
ncbi:hypothetical protein [Iodobacter fluviatilis]|uniref:Uncharacterized protein n=1 Tax=Iodobacter fluviatilis TaxID=537 RepID=A0A7G3GD29_9NEIS|nr:hypothetical protein [Iodobacter fluviatilis]QBC45054.1 hypothetical protein C1H71_16925 [Iodobacter fluviatilis]